MDSSTDELDKLRDEVTNLHRALQSRDLIGQAKGILMATMNCDADEAFSILSEQSQRENRKIVEIASEIVERTNRRARGRAD